MRMKALTSFVFELKPLHIFSGFRASSQNVIHKCLAFILADAPIIHIFWALWTATIRVVCVCVCVFVCGVRVCVALCVWVKSECVNWFSGHIIARLLKMGKEGTSASSCHV
jgi:hypothetical protein